MKIASWNVNSLKVRLPQVLEFLRTRRPDVLALQETKLSDDNFPHAEFEALGYHAVFSGQKTYNGVALISREAPREIITDIPGLDDHQRRILGACIGPLRVLNLYVVNGQEVGSDKFDYKLAWLEKVTAFVAEDLKRHPDYLIVGDFNIAPDDRDVYDPEAWRERILCSTPEREALRRLLDLGFTDCFRHLHPDERQYSWWDYRAAAFRRNMGLRIDLILTSEPLLSRCVGAAIDVEPRRWERPSDHAPVIAEFKL